MAAFIARARQLAVSGEDFFTDDDGDVFERSINSIAKAGITFGCSPPVNDEFCPDRQMTRGEMAAMLARAFDLPASPVDYFLDDDGDRFEDVINRIAGAGITFGCNPPVNDRFCPGALITRAQMATFLTRSLGLVPAHPPVSTALCRRCRVPGVMGCRPAGHRRDGAPCDRADHGASCRQLLRSHQPSPDPGMAGRAHDRAGLARSRLSPGDRGRRHGLRGARPGIFAGTPTRHTTRQGTSKSCWTGTSRFNSPTAAQWETLVVGPGVGLRAIRRVPGHHQRPPRPRRHLVPGTASRRPHPFRGVGGRRSPFDRFRRRRV